MRRGRSSTTTSAPSTCCSDCCARRRVWPRACSSRFDVTLEEVRDAGRSRRRPWRRDHERADPVHAAASKKVLELALREALSLGHNYIGTEHVLLGLVRENEGVAATDPARVRRGLPRRSATSIIGMLSAPGATAARRAPRPSAGARRPTPSRSRRPGSTCMRACGAARSARRDRERLLATRSRRAGSLVAVVSGGRARSEWVVQLRRARRVIGGRPRYIDDRAGPRRRALTRRSSSRPCARPTRRRLRWRPWMRAEVSAIAASDEGELAVSFSAWSTQALSMQDGLSAGSPALDVLVETSHARPTKERRSRAQDFQQAPHSSSRGTSSAADLPATRVCSLHDLRAPPSAKSSRAVRSTRRRDPSCGARVASDRRLSVSRRLSLRKIEILRRCNWVYAALCARRRPSSRG